MKIFTMKNFFLLSAAIAEAQTTEQSATGEAAGWITPAQEALEGEEGGLEASTHGKVEARRYGDLKNIAEVIFTHPGNRDSFICK